MKETPQNPAPDHLPATPGMPAPAQGAGEETRIQLVERLTRQLREYKEAMGIVDTATVSLTYEEAPDGSRGEWKVGKIVAGKWEIDGGYYYYDFTDGGGKTVNKEKAITQTETRARQFWTSLTEESE